MINYSAVINIIKSEKYIDKSDCFEHFWGLKHVTLENCAHTGSSLFLKAFACFLDERLNATNVFQQMRVGKTTDFSKEINSYRVLYLDFSDFNARNYDEANRYIKAKMADAYKDFYCLFDYGGSRIGSYQAFEDALDIIGGTASEQVLQRSLYNLQTVTDAQAINLEDMYNNYIAKWNADIYEEGDYGTFKSESALSFIVIMDTLDAILGKTEINDDSALLSKDSKLWNILSASHCWEDVNERWNQTARSNATNIQ